MFNYQNFNCRNKQLNIVQRVNSDLVVLAVRCENGVT